MGVVALFVQDALTGKNVFLHCKALSLRKAFLLSQGFGKQVVQSRRTHGARIRWMIPLYRQFRAHAHLLGSVYVVAVCSDEHADFEADAALRRARDILVENVRGGHEVSAAELGRKFGAVSTLLEESLLALDAFDSHRILNRKPQDSLFSQALERNSAYSPSAEGSLLQAQAQARSEGIRAATRISLTPQDEVRMQDPGVTRVTEALQDMGSSFNFRHFLMNHDTASNTTLSASSSIEFPTGQGASAGTGVTGGAGGSSSSSSKPQGSPEATTVPVPGVTVGGGEAASSSSAAASSSFPEDFADFDLAPSGATKPSGSPSPPPPHAPPSRRPPLDKRVHSGQSLDFGFEDSFGSPAPSESGEQEEEPEAGEKEAASGAPQGAEDKGQGGGGGEEEDWKQDRRPPKPLPLSVLLVEHMESVCVDKHLVSGTLKGKVSVRGCRGASSGECNGGFEEGEPMEITLETSLPRERLQPHPDRGQLLPGSSMEADSTAALVSIPFRSATVGQAVCLAMFSAEVPVQPLRTSFACTALLLDKPPPSIAAGNTALDVTCTCTLRGWPLLPAPLEELRLELQVELPEGLVVRRERSRPGATIQGKSRVVATFPAEGQALPAEHARLPARGALAFVLRLLVEDCDGTGLTPEQLQRHLLTQPGALRAVCSFALPGHLLSSATPWIKNPLLGITKVRFEGRQVTTPV